MYLNKIKGKLLWKTILNKLLLINNIISILIYSCNTKVKNKINSITLLKKRRIIRILDLSRYFHQRVRAINRIGPHNLDTISVIIGLILGNGECHRVGGEGIKIFLRKRGIYKEYITYLHKFFLDRGYCSNLKPRMYLNTFRHKDKLHISKGYELNTYTFRSFGWIYKIFYKNNIKIIPVNISEFITPITLAIWLSENGSKLNGGIKLKTNGLTLQDTNRLVEVLRLKYDLDVSIQYLSKKDDKFIIYIKKNSVSKLIDIIIPYLNISIYHKLGIKP